MSETEAQKDLATEQPTAEELKGVKRAAEVRIQPNILLILHFLRLW